MEKISKANDLIDLDHDFEQFEKLLDNTDTFSNHLISQKQAVEPLTLVAFPGDLLASETKISSSPQLSGQAKISTSSEDTTIEVSLEAGAHVSHTAKGDYIAEQYGYVRLDDNRLSIVSPLIISDDLLHVDWMIPAEHPKGVTLEMLEFWLKKEEIVLESDNLLHELIKQLNEGIISAGYHPVAIGRAVVPGDNGRIEWQVQLEQSVGFELPDGRIDFRERNFVINVKTEQVVARLIKAQKGQPGCNVKGQVLPAVGGLPVELVAGKNIRKIETDPAEVLYIATIDGGLHYNGNTVSVSKTLVLSDGVNFQTGNIEFDGDVIIHGLVVSGFSVEAGGDVFVAGTIDDGIKIVAQGDVIVSRSISGKRTVVEAGGSVRTQVINESLVKAGQKILLGNYALHAKLRTNGIIQISIGNKRRKIESELGPVTFTLYQNKLTTK